jgi:hypothetical protein
VANPSFKLRWERWTAGAALRHHEDKVLLVLTLVIGAVVGLVVAAFIYVPEDLGARLYPVGGAAWRRLVMPVTGALFTGYLLSRYFPNARGSGIPQTKAALYPRDGFITFCTVLGNLDAVRHRWRAASHSGAKAPRYTLALAWLRYWDAALASGPRRSAI